MNRPTRDLFDDSTMSFGEHLEVLRVHLIRAIIGLVIAVIICLLNGRELVNIIRRPIDDALANYSNLSVQDDVKEGLTEQWGLDVFKRMFWGRKQVEYDDETGEAYVVEEVIKPHPEYIKVRVPLEDLARALHRVSPEQFPPPSSATKPAEAQATDGVESPPASAAADNSTAANGEPASENPARPANITLTLQASQFAQFQATVEQSRQAVTLNVQEAFLTYVKVSLIAGVILSSPWIFYQLWLFVAAGLYPHERKYVYVYGTMSLGLFLLGAVFCFYAVFPFVLDFLLKFNATLEISPQIRISEWISFAVMLPVMFGVSFQLPLVMLFLERISIFQVQQYREQRRMAIFVIAVVSMLLTPADPMSMLLMMIPLIGLYELGIKLCQWLPAASPLDDDQLLRA